MDIQFFNFLNPIDKALLIFTQIDLLVHYRNLYEEITTFIFMKFPIYLQNFMPQNQLQIFRPRNMILILDFSQFYKNIYNNNNKNYKSKQKKMLKFMHRLQRFNFAYKTQQQQNFIQSLTKMKFKSEDETVKNIAAIYNKRQYLQKCEIFDDISNQIQNYFLKTSKCSVFQLQSYYKLKEMKMISIPFKHNLKMKYHKYLLNDELSIKNEHVEKLLWFLYSEGKYDQELFREVGENYVLRLFQVYQYMNGLEQLPTWEPYVRVTNMLKFMGHQLTLHRNLGSKKALEKLNYKYYPYVASLLSPQDFQPIQIQNKYDLPFLVYLCQQYFIKNNSHYDTYLQKIEIVQLEMQYDRIYDTTEWSQLGPMIDMLKYSFEVNGKSEQFQSGLSNIYFRLFQYTDIDLESAAEILEKMLGNASFMYSRRYPIITRATDAILNKTLEDFRYLPTDGYVSMLESSRQLAIDVQSKEYFQEYVCGRMKDKAIWNVGERQRVMELLETNKYAGSKELLEYLKNKKK